MKSLTQMLLDHIDSGLMYIDEEERISYLNRAAKVLTGVIHGSKYSHPAGKVEKGDILLLADVSLGGDDGGLRPEDLHVIGWHEPELETGDSFVAIGSYQNPSFLPKYRFFRGEYPARILSLQMKHRGKKLSAKMDLRDRILTLGVDDVYYDLSYLFNIGHIVILDGKTLEVKFFQAKGYSYRQETIRSILMGEPFLAKKDAQEELDIIGLHARDVFGEGPFLKAVRSLLNGEVHELRDQFFQLHKRQFLCNLTKMDKEHFQGVSVGISDVSDLGNLLKKHEHMIETIERSIPNLVTPKRRKIDKQLETIQGQSPAMMEVKYLITRAAKHDSNIFLTGENGTGKTVVARAIHKLGRPKRPFIEVNCGAIPQSLFESELFGYAPGSFTGALPQGKEGFFQLAQGGTIFLDEIAEIPPPVQAKLLHVLQDKRFYPIGADQPITIEARVIAATNRNIRNEILAGNFREDLYYRLNVFPIAIPPLRKRQEDIYFLSNRLIRDLCQRHGLSQKRLSHSAYQSVLAYDWPGNVRQLENILERAVLICESSTIYPEHLNLAAQEAPVLLLSEVRQLAEKRAMQQALLITKEKEELADMLGISLSTLYQKLRDYQLIG